MKVLISDYDGTFYTNEESIKTNIDKTNEFMKKNIFVIATGRSLQDFKRKEEEYDIKYNYLIINHGATIIKDNQTIYNKIINKNILPDILKDIDIENTDFNFFCNNQNSRVSSTEKELTKIHVSYASEEKLNEIYDKLISKYNEYINIYIMNNKKSLEIISNEANKTNAIEFLITHEKFSKKDIYTIGDNQNDLEMIKDYNGAIMTNSILELKQLKFKEYLNVSDYIIDIEKND